MNNDPVRKLRAVGYCRTSGEGQRDNTSIPRQREAIQEFCARRGWEFLRHYVDESKSGSTIVGRDDFQRMMKDAALDQFDLIIPFDVSRFARDGVDILSNAKFLRENFAVHVVDTKGGFDSTPGGNVLANYLHAGVSEYERLKIMERMIGGRIRRAQEGKPWSGKQPFGRTYVKETGKWEINDRGRRMRALLERYVNGEGLSKLVREEFTEFNDPVTVLNFVRNSQLSGIYVKEFNIKELGIIELKIPIPAIPPIISEELYERVRARSAKLRQWHEEHRRRYILSGFVRCGHCGMAMTGNVGRYYRHCNPKASACVFKSIPEKELVEPVLDFLYSFILDEPAFNNAISAALPTDDERQEIEREKEELAREQTKLDKERKAFSDAIKEGIKAALLLDEQSRIEADIARLSERQKHIAEKLRRLPDQAVLEAEADLIRLSIHRNMQQRNWRELPFDEVKRFLIFLFGENPTGGDGITVKREDGVWQIGFRGRVSFLQDVIADRPVNHRFLSEAKGRAAEIDREFEARCAAADQRFAEAEAAREKRFREAQAAVVALTQQT